LSRSCALSPRQASCTANDKKKDAPTEDNKEAEERAKVHKDKVAKKKAELKKKHEDAAKAEEARLAGMEEHKKMMGDEAIKVLSPDLKVLLIEMFKRYDLDGSKFIDSKDELKQLVTNLVVKLEIDMTMAKIDELVDAESKKATGIKFDEDAFALWFVDPTNNSAADSIKTWSRTDLEPEDEQTGYAPFILGPYAGVLTDEEGNKFTTEYTGKEGTKMTNSIFRVDIQSALFSANEEFYDKEEPFFNETAPSYKWVMEQKEVVDGQVPLTERKGCDNVGFYKSTGWITKDGTFHYERSYDIDNDKDSKEPWFILDGKVSEDGKTLEGKWEDKNSDEVIKSTNSYNGMKVSEMREKCTHLKGAQGKFQFAHEKASE